MVVVAHGSPNPIGWKSLSSVSTATPLTVPQSMTSVDKADRVALLLMTGKAELVWFRFYAGTCAEEGRTGATTE